MGHGQEPNYAKMKGVHTQTVFRHWRLNVEHVGYKISESGLKIKHEVGSCGRKMPWITYLENEKWAVMVTHQERCVAAITLYNILATRLSGQ